MSTDNLSSIWSMATKDEILTAISGILTVLLITSGVQFLYYIGWAIGAWTIICFIGLFRNQLIRNKTKDCVPPRVKEDILIFLQKNFQDDEFITQTHEWQTKRIEHVTDILVEIIRQTYKEGKNNE